MGSGGRESVRKGASLEREIEVALGARAGVVVHRNMVAHATLKSGAQVLTGIGGKGAPDFMIEVRDPRGRWVCVWVESKNGDHAKLSRDQRDWHAAAALLGRHVVLARSIHDVVGAVERVQQGAMP
jgi:hypothetical protein